MIVGFFLREDVMILACSVRRQTKVDFFLVGVPC